MSNDVIDCIRVVAALSVVVGGLTVVESSGHGIGGPKSDSSTNSAWVPPSNSSIIYI